MNNDLPVAAENIFRENCDFALTRMDNCVSIVGEWTEMDQTFSAQDTEHAPQGKGGLWLCLLLRKRRSAVCLVHLSAYAGDGHIPAPHHRSGRTDPQGEEPAR